MATFNPSTDQQTIISPGVQIIFSHPPTIYETFGDGLDSPGNSLSSFGIEQAAISFVKKYLGDFPPYLGVTYTSGYRIGKMTYSYLHQVMTKTRHGTRLLVPIPIANAFANIAWKDDLVVAFGHSLVNILDLIADEIPTWNINTVIPMAEQALNGTHNGHPVKLEYLANQNGHLSLVHTVQIQNEALGTWYEAFMDAHSGQLLSLTNFVSHATYTVLPIPGEAAPPDGFKVLTDPEDNVSSPSIISYPGWHSVGTTTTTTTAGNNVISYKGEESSITSESSSSLNFNYSFDKDKNPEYNLDAARVNAFYVANTVHDFFHRYGFTEAAFNFQGYNFNQGGKEDDRILMSIQETTKTNNSSFHTPPDGQSGICHLFLYNKTTPKRDAAFDNGIVIHELTHGMTNRMTGGGTSRSLQTVEARGLGEGWSDAIADWAYQTSAPIKDYAHAVYATGKAEGNRMYLYSTSDKTNPLRYSDVKKILNDENPSVHKIGEVWANILHNVHAALVDKYGFSNTAMTNPDGTEGNIVFLHLFIDALALQPVKPTFVFARQAWIQADANRYNGANQEVLWKAFASRGLGVGAANYNESKLLPSHFKPLVIQRGQVKLPPLSGGWDGGVAPGSIVSVCINPQTIVTIFGLVTATYNQKVKAELIDADLGSQATVFFDGVNKEYLTLEDSTKKAVTWGPFDKQMTVELTFYHKTDVGASWDISGIIGDKMKEYLDEDLQTAISLIPIDDGGDDSQDYQNTTLNVTRMTLF